MKTKNIALTLFCTLLFMNSVGLTFPAYSSTTGIVALWHFEEGEGSNAGDSSGNGHDGVLSGGKFSNALYFDGDGDYVEIPNSVSMDVSATYTFEAWIYLESYGTEGISGLYRGFFRRGTSGIPASEIEIYTQPYHGGYGHPGALTFVHNRGDGTFGYRYYTPFPLDTWVHLAVTWDGSTARAYYDGVEQASTGTSVSNAIETDKTSFIGMGYYTAFMKGKIDEVRFSDNIRYSGSFSVPSAPFLTDGNTVGLWHFDESVGTIAEDSSSYGNDGNIVDATWAGPVWVDGKYGKCLTYDGLDDYVLLDDNEFTNADVDEYTFEAWVQISSLDEVERRIFDDEGGLRPLLTSGNKLQAFHWAGGSKTITWSTTPSTNTWYHIAQTYDGSELRFYIDGELIGVQACGAWTPDSFNREVNLGTWWQGLGRNWKGLIDEARLWDSALSMEKIKSIANGLVGEWDFNEGSGTTAYDSSGFENHGTIHGGVSYTSGRYGHALSFDGTGYVDCGEQVDDILSNEITLEAWIKPSGTQRGGIISSDVTYYVPHLGYDFFLWDDGTHGRLYIDFGNGATLGRKWYDIPSPDWYNQWHHVTSTWDGGIIKLYVDGTEVTSQVYAGPYADSERDTLLGAISYSSVLWKFDGIIDEVRIWSQALTPVSFTQTGLEGDSVGTVVTVSDPIPLEESELPYVMMVPDGSDWEFVYEAEVLSLSSSKRYYFSGASDTSPITVSGPTTVTGTYVVDFDPEANANGPYTGDEGSPISLDGSGSYEPAGGSLVIWEWDLDYDGEYDDASGKTISHIWSDDGSYTIGLKVTDDDGDTDTADASVTVYDLGPTAEFDWSPKPQDEDSPVAFSDLSTSSPDAIVSWSWDFGDTGSSSNQNPSHTYLDNGAYTVTLTVTDDDGSTDSVSHSVIINNVAPSATASASPGTINEDESVTVSGSITDPGSLDTFVVAINWGDGNSETFGYPAGTTAYSETHQYLDDDPSGTHSDFYTVTVIVTDDDTGAFTTGTTVTVYNLAPVTDAGSDQTVNVWDTVSFSGSFTDQGTIDTHTAVWDWGDGSPIEPGTVTESEGSGTVAGSHVYSAFGVYVATLTVTDDDTGHQSDIVTITVLPYSIVTDSSLCTNFDKEPDTDGTQFRLIFSPDLENDPSLYKISATNPGQFYYNMFQIGAVASGESFEVDVPYPFITKGANPVHVYDDVEVLGSGCYSYSGANDITDQFDIMWRSGLSFDGSDDYVMIPDDNSLDITAEISIEVWVKFDSVPGTIIRKGPWPYSPDPSPSWGLDSPGGKLRAFIYDDSNAVNKQAYGSTALQTDVWYHIAFTYDGDYIRIYLNGVEDGSIAYSGDIDESDYNIWIGRKDGEDWFDGEIDEVRISNVARTSFDVDRVLAPDGDVVSMWCFDEEHGQTAYDTVGSNDGQLGSSIEPDIQDPAWTRGISVTPENSLSGVTWITMHLDYGLKKTGGYEMHLYKDAADVWRAHAMKNSGSIYDLTEYVFTVSGPVSDSQTIQNRNEFKKIRGIAGQITGAGAGVAVHIIGGSIETTVYTDEDGWYGLEFKHTGKPTDYTVYTDGHTRIINLKPAHFVEVNFP